MTCFFLAQKCPFTLVVSSLINMPFSRLKTLVLHQRLPLRLSLFNDKIVRNFSVVQKSHDVLKIFNLTLLLVQSETLVLMDYCEDKDIEVTLYNPK